MIRITKVTANESSAEQPISVWFEGDNNKPYKPCKSMRRVLIHVWGKDGTTYPGRSMRLHRDAKVQFGGLEVGGIRISHMSNIDKSITMALTATKANKKAYTVQPLQARPGWKDLIAALPDRQACVDFLADGSDAKKAFDKLDEGKRQTVMDMLADRRASFLSGPQEPQSDDVFPDDIPDALPDDRRFDDGDLAPSAAA